MGREIKFEYVWKFEGEITRQVFSLEQIEQGEPEDFKSCCYTICAKLLARRQYTGLKDKNGKNIYDGDIVKVWDYDEEGNIFELLGIFEVFYDDELCMFSIKNEEENWTPNPLGAFKQIEVIGNVFENKDLLDNKN